jgi:DNA-binding MarR family transcriptional regulator
VGKDEVGTPSEGRGRARRTPRAQARGPRATPADAHHLDKLVHERMRLGILSALAVNESLSFTDLKALLRTTDGNLSVHARKLEQAHFIACTKRFEDRLPRTEFRLTASGRRALEEYLDRMEALIRAARER